MFPSTFDYRRANSVQEAIALLGQNPDAKIIAGGHSLLPAMKLRLATPPLLIDISKIQDLKGMRRTDDGAWRIGALTTHAEVAARCCTLAHAPVTATRARVTLFLSSVVTAAATPTTAKPDAGCGCLA